MADPQPGLFAQGLIRHHHVEFRIRPTARLEDVRAAITQARRDAMWVAGPNVSWAFSPTLWSQLAPGQLPPSVAPLHDVVGRDGLRAPATQYDIWVWCSAATARAVERSANAVISALAGVAELTQQLPAYTADDGRDPTGFIDGTENPLPDEALEIAVFDGGPGDGGSAVVVQKWVHNLAAFEALPIPAQEEVIGRTKPDSVELTDDRMPPTSHVKRNTVLDEAGEERHIFRKNTPFDHGGETGTLFIGLTNDTELILTMLDRMFGATSDGLTDHLTRFSTPVTGSMYFAPSMSALTEVFAALGDDNDDDDAAEGTDPNRLPTDGNLRIGSLREMLPPTRLSE